MKKIKKFICLLLVFTFLLSLTSNVYAMEEYINLNYELGKKGYPEIVLETMNEDAKKDIYERELCFTGATILYYNDKDGSFQEVDVNEDGSYVLPRGQISTANLNLTCVFSEKINSDGDVEYINVICNYTWIKTPVCRWQDPIGISWDDTLLELKENSFKKVDKYNYSIVDTNTGLATHYTNAIHSQENGYASASPAGVTWYADLKGDIGIIVSKLYGYASFDLETKVDSASTKVYVHYVHSTAIPITGLSLSIKKFGSFSVGGIGTYDERATHKELVWPKISEI